MSYLIQNLKNDHTYNLKIYKYNSESYYAEIFIKLKN